jgi:hypothetical protein
MKAFHPIIFYFLQRFEAKYLIMTVLITMIIIRFVNYVMVSTDKTNWRNFVHILHKKIRKKYDFCPFLQLLPLLMTIRIRILLIIYNNNAKR